MRGSRRRATRSDSVIVVGLGRFGTAVAQSLIEMGREVLAIDESADLVQRWSADLTHTVQADTTDEESLRQLGVAEYERAVVAIGTDVEASVLTVLALSDAGVQEIWAKAITAKHGEILERIGATHVVYPERAMGQRVAHMLAGSMDDYLEFEAGYAMARMKAPIILWGVPLKDSAARRRYRVTVVGIKSPGEPFTYADNETIVHQGDQIIISGPVKNLEEFSRLPTARPPDDE